LRATLWRGGVEAQGVVVDLEEAVVPCDAPCFVYSYDPDAQAVVLRDRVLGEGDVLEVVYRGSSGL